MKLMIVVCGLALAIGVLFGWVIFGDPEYIMLSIFAFIWHQTGAWTVYINRERL